MDEIKNPVTEQPTAEPSPALEATTAEIAKPEATAETNVAPAEAETTSAATETTSAEAEVTPAEAEAPKRQIPETKQGVIDRLNQIAENGEDPERAEIDALKQAYYRIHSAEAAKAREAFIEGGGDAAEFIPAPDTDEEAFKAAFSRVREIRQAAFEAAEQEKQAGLARKLEIIELIKTYAATPEEADKHFDDVKTLQAEWKEIKKVPAENATELWKNYQLYVEQFYDQLHLHHEMRAYDFKKNLEKKTELCEAAERLADVEDVVSAFQQLQSLHQLFREIGPVAKEQREEIWKRFKEASTVINKRHQEHFEGIKAREEENLAKKTELCEKAEAIETEGLTTFSQWDAITKTVLELQAEWKTIGFTPRSKNAQIFDRFRKACDAFFTAKTDYFKKTRETLNANLAKKKELVAEVEALKESTDWGATTSKLVALQKAWKEIGPVPHKVSDEIWAQFNAACNYFFEQKKAATAGQRQEEDANFEKKQGIIAEIEQLAEGTAEDMLQKIKALQAEWNETGHVPFRKKERIYKAYRQACDEVYDKLKASGVRRNLEAFKKKVEEKAGTDLSRERQRLLSALEAKKQEIKTYETNLTFFSAKTASAILEDVNRKIATLKDDLTLISEKLAAVNEKIKNGEEQ